MLINLLQKDFDVQLKEYSSKTEMLSDISLCKNGYTVLRNSEYENRFISIKYSYRHDNKYYGIGFWCSNFVFSPIALLYANVFVISFDNCITFFDTENDNEKTTHIFSYPLEYLELYENTIIAISELNLIKMNLNGDILSEYSFDSSLLKYKIIDDKIICRTEKGTSEYTII